MFVCLPCLLFLFLSLPLVRYLHPKKSFKNLVPRRLFWAKFACKNDFSVAIPHRERERVRDVSEERGNNPGSFVAYTRRAETERSVQSFLRRRANTEREREREAPRIINSSSSSSGKRGYLACYHKEHKKKTDLDDDDDDVSTTASALCRCYFFFFFFIRRRRRWIVVVPTTPSTRSRGVDDDEQNWNRCCWW